MATIRLENLYKKFGDVHAVKNVNLEIRDKELLILLGPSGCGKTTTLRMIAGLEVPSEGKIYLDGEDITYTHPKDRKVSLVFQSYALYPHMTASQNISFPLMMKRTPRRKMEEQVKKVAVLLKIDHLLRRRPKELSGGERQRVALGRAIVKEPKIFLMDEPLSNVDAKLRVYLRAEIKKLQKELGITTIYVTHDQVEAMTIADRIGVMDRGELKQVSTPEDLYNNPQNLFVASFIGSPPMNLINGRVVEDSGRFFFDEGAFRVEIPPKLQKICPPLIGEEVVLGIRAEDVVLNGDGEINSALVSVEPLGYETLLILKAGRSVIRAITRGLMPLIEEEVQLSFKKEGIFLFDKKTEKRCV